MSLLHYLSYVGAAAAFIFVTLSLASGLLWLSELIEENSRNAKIIGQRGIYAIMLLHVLLYLSDSLPLVHILFSIACHIVYLQNFTDSWPVISLGSLSFVLSCILVVTDHFMWFFYFARITQDARHRTRSTYHEPRQTAIAPGFADIATFFGICVWLAPLFLFLSLSANDNALPMNLNANGQGSVPNSPISPHPLTTRPRASLFKTIYDALPLDSLPRFKPRRRDTSQGIIAPPPPSPRPGSSPLPSPGLNRVLSAGSLPPPMSSPRRFSTESQGSSGQLVAEPEDLFLSPGRGGSFSLSMPPPTAPPRRSKGGSGLEMRRAVSAGAGLWKEKDA